MSSVLEELKQGSHIQSRDEPKADFLDHIPEDLDREKFDRGRQFFMRNVTGCIRGMFLSLVVGLSVDNLLDVLVQTGETSNPHDSFRRYFKTTVHVLKWHYGNIWDRNSSARKSILYVRNRHYKVRELLQESDRACNIPNCFNKKRLVETGKMPIISQYDMSLVQAGFIGLIVLYPHRCGIKCTEAELDDFVYVWRWIGYSLGIDDKNNICIGGYERAYRISKAIENEIILPSLRKSPKHFEPMANAFLAGIRIASQGCIRFRLNSIVGLAFEASGTPLPFNVSFKDRIQMLLDYALSYACMYVPGLARLLNFVFEKAFSCHKMT